MKKLILLLACSLLIGGAVSAQTMKIGYIQSQELLSVMPEVIGANKQIEAYAKTYEDQIKQMTDDYQKKVQYFQANEKTMTDAIKEVKVKEIQDLQKRIEDFNQKAQDAVEKKRQDLLKPILEKADKAIKDVATENGYDYVIDASIGTLLHANPAYNILPQVKAKLGIK